MLRDLIKEGGLYSLANLVTKGISLLLIPFYTTYFSPTDYGVIDLLNLFALFINAVFTLQLNQGLARYVTEPKLNEDERLSFSSTAIWFTSMVLILVTALLLLFPNYIVDMLSAESEIKYQTFRLATGTIFFNAIFYLLGVLQRFIRKSLQFTLLSFIHSIAGITGILYFTIYKNYGIDSIYLSYLIVVPPLVLIQIILLRKYLRFIIDIKKLKKLLLFSIPLVPAAIATIIMNFTDRIYIKEYLDLNELGIYAMGSKFASIFTLVISGISMAIGPIILQQYDKAETKLELGRIFRLYLAIGAFSVIAISIFSHEIVTAVTDKNFHDSAKIIPILIFTGFFIGLNMFSPGLTIRKKTAITSIIVVIFSFLNVLLNHLLIPEYELYGAAFATFIATLLYQTVYFLLSQRHYQFPFVKSQVLIVITLTGLTLLTNYYFLNDLDNFYQKLLLKFLLLTLIVFIIHLSKIFTWSELKTLINKSIKKA
ncbi:oligosaccharide flippase family protein [Paracrocinitomix mangrovi]|uniref:lipopolysaccharide biosynthesis protein n=1 Tax=Paracrocinitomix mangrovi TaxID=2862509 RepID=UPI001C8DD44F|nr:oligosaccharide flippase family protein [Paracrocinitomix mangrovi]UKN01242.1 oligosaccharide flippase family protein [Paracrocinitomix mangrovi]